MTFVYFWLVCGLIAFCLHIMDEWNKGKDITVGASLRDLFWSSTLGLFGLIAMLGIYNKVIIRGRKK